LSDTSATEIKEAYFIFD